MGARSFACALTATAASLLFLAPIAQAEITDAFDGAADCSEQGDGSRHCSGIVESFEDGAPIDVNLALPEAPGAGPDGDYPVVGIFHGWGGSKISNDSGTTKSFLARGYAVFSMSDRGWGNSCGGADPKRLQPGVCDNGYNHLMDSRYEVRDAQYLLGLLVDDGLIDPVRIGATGGSYGGGISMALAALKNRVMIDEGETDSLVPWTSPDGVPMELAAAQPDIPWTDLAYSLMPTGRTLDYVADAPYGIDGRVGVMKQSFVSGLYGLGLPLSNYAPPGTDEDADLHGWYSLVSAGEPYDTNPLAADVIDEITTHHSSYYIDNSVEPAPLLISNGFTDDLFPPDEAIRFYNKTKAAYPDAELSLLFSDHGHQRGQGRNGAERSARRDAWFDYYLLGDGPKPPNQVEVFSQECGADPLGPFTAPTWKDLAPGEIRFTSPEPVLISPEAGDPSIGQAYDPIAGGGACATGDALDQPGLANYRLDPAPAGGFTLAGSPTIIADVLSPGPNNQLAARLVDVDPGGEQTLVARALFRPTTAAGTDPEREVFQLHPNNYRFDEGHVAKLELLPNDAPYSRKSNGQTAITVSDLELRLPVLEAPGTAGAVEPGPRVVPDGYELAPDYIADPVDGDGDGVIDGDDDCPDDPGPAENGGCPLPDPDSDDDGVPDSTDACPDDPGPVENGGCPLNDGDGDGIPDGDDDCPAEPGPASNGGCPVPPPDGDGDGVEDAADPCPEEPGPASNHGCPLPPDSDGDEIPDSDDACPDEPGPTSNGGCPVPEPPPPLEASKCEVQVLGSSKADRIFGTIDSERIRSRGGADRVKARAGDDCVYGADGRDRLNGGRGNDEVNGGRGNDRIRVRDGARDVVLCGAGNDRVTADRRDKLVGCERVRFGDGRS